MTTHEQLHPIIDRLDDRAAAEALPLLARLATTSRSSRDDDDAPIKRAMSPLDRALANAPLDDEPVTEEEERAVAVARQALARGETLTSSELRRELGL